MKKAVTLKQNHEFRRMYRKGASAVGGGMVVYCHKNRLGHNRLGVVSSVKIGKAVVRNRSRRRLREVYRLHKDELANNAEIENESAVLNNLIYASKIEFEKKSNKAEENQ